MTEYQSQPNELGRSVVPNVVLRSNELAEFAGTTTRTLRHYHQIGLLDEPPRDANGYRRYSAHDLIRVLRIRQLATSGMPLRQIADVLDQGPQELAEVLDALDEQLQAQETSIREQRKLVADLREASSQPAWIRHSGPPTATQQLDRDLWTLLSAEGGIDEDKATNIQTALNDDRLTSRAAEWYEAFENLEGITEIDDQKARDLAAQIAEFAHAAMELSGLVPATEELPIMAMAEQIQADALSPAQQQVWQHFMALIN